MVFRCANEYLRNSTLVALSLNAGEWKIISDYTCRLFGFHSADRGSTPLISTSLRQGYGWHVTSEQHGDVRVFFFPFLFRFVTYLLLSKATLRRTYRRRVIVPIGPVYKANKDITSSHLRLIDEKGENVGVVTTVEAKAMAERVGYDLVEVSPNADPPVAKILDFSQFKYQRDKESQKAKQKQKKQETKGVRLSTRIGAHDLELRLNQATKFLDEGHKLKIELLLRGREHQHRELAEATINEFIAGLKERYTITIEQPVQKVGGRMSLICAGNGKVVQKAVS